MNLPSQRADAPMSRGSGSWYRIDVQYTKINSITHEVVVDGCNDCCT
jgi:hypothetical protein